MSKSHPRWRLAKKILTWLFFIAVIVLLVVYAKKVDWEEVWKVIRDYNRVALRISQLLKRYASTWLRRAIAGRWRWKMANYWLPSTRRW